MDRICKSPNRTGEPCAAQHYRDGYCRWHHPDLAVQRQAERAAGGAARSNRNRARKKIAEQAMSISDIDGMLCSTLTDVAAGKMEPGIGTSLATIAKTVVAIRSTGELERRLEDLEHKAATRMGRIG